MKNLNKLMRDTEKKKIEYVLIGYLVLLFDETIYGKHAGYL